MVWAAGVAASPLGRKLADAVGARTDRAGRVLVEPDLTNASVAQLSQLGNTIPRLTSELPKAAGLGTSGVATTSINALTQLRTKDEVARLRGVAL